MTGGPSSVGDNGETDWNGGRSMPYTVSQVMNSAPESLLTVSLDARAAAQRVDAQIDRARTRFAHLADDWTGTAADAAQKQGRESLDEQTTYRDHLYAVAKPLATGGAQLTELRANLKKAVDAAQAQWDVADDGGVTPGFWLRWYARVSPVQALQIAAKRIEVENAIKLLLAKFEAADRDTGHQIRKVGWELA